MEKTLMLDEKRLCRNVAAAVIEALKANSFISEQFMTREEVSQVFNVGYTTLWTWNKLGKLKPVKVGRKLYYKVEDIKLLLKGE